MNLNSVHFLSIKWREEKPHFIYRPDRRIDKEEGFEINEATQISVKVEDERRCIGDNGPCPYDRVLTGKSKRGNKCFVCGQRDFVQYMPLQALSEAQHDILKTQPHFNYINLFGPELLKVGVASQHNKRKRVLEQGAYATMYFAEGDGFTVRQIEDLVSIVLKVKQHVSWTAKYKVINLKPPQTTVQELFKKTFHDIIEIIPDQYKESTFSEPEIVMNFEKYHITLPNTLSEIRTVDAYSVGDTISGRIVGIYGLIIFIENSSEIYAVNTKNLEGFIISVTDEEQPQNLINPARSIAIQKPEITLDLF